MDWHILHCGSCVKLTLSILAFIFLGCWWITWRFAWFFVALGHIIVATAFSVVLSVVLTLAIIIGKHVRAWWKRGHPSPLPAFPNLAARKLRVRPQTLTTADPEHVYVVTDAAKPKFKGMQG
jgi:hypothetical protein